MITNTIHFPTLDNEPSMKARSADKAMVKQKEPIRSVGKKVPKAKYKNDV